MMHNFNRTARSFLAIRGVALRFLLLAPLTVASAQQTQLRWELLAPIPDPLGVAGAFSGISGGALLVAGSANFPDKMPWEGGAKVWHDDVFVLENPDGSWRKAGRLPRPLAYGVALSHKLGLVCIGGSDATRHHASSFVVRWTHGQLNFTSLPDLPMPCANMSGALVGDVLYLAGGLAAPDSTNALNDFLSLDLSLKQPRWRRLEPSPGPGRMLATAAALDGSFYFFGGAALHAGPDAKPVREYLRDAYRYAPGKGWKRIADLPHAIAAAPSPAPVVNGKLLIIGGDDGTQINAAQTEHKGFRHDMLAYDPKADRWEKLDEAPFAQVTTSAVLWKDRIVIPSGEVRPGVRTPEVWSASTR